MRLRTGTRVVDLVWPRFTAGTHVADGITVSKDGNSVRTGQQMRFMGSSVGKNAAVGGTYVADPATAFDQFTRGDLVNELDPATHTSYVESEFDVPRIPVWVRATQFCSVRPGCA